jgi:hypothetical protein
MDSSLEAKMGTKRKEVGAVLGTKRGITGTTSGTKRKEAGVVSGAKREVMEKKLIERLKAHPDLMTRVERILDLAENTGGDVIRAAEAEERTIREIKALGQEVLQDWATRRVEEASKQAAGVGEIRYKKNGSTGTAVLEK